MMIALNRAPLMFVALLVSGTFSAGAQTEVERSLRASPDGIVEITTVSGSVVVLGWDREEIEVRGTLDRGVEELKVEQRGARTEIRVVVENRGRNRSRADLEIKVPRHSRVDLETVSAELTVSDLAGEADIETVSGAAHIEGDLQLLELESVSGAVDVRGAISEIAVETVSGGVTLSGSFPNVEVSVVSGKVTVDSDQIRRGELESVSGTINLSSDLANGGSLDVSSHSGSVVLTLPSSVSAEFDVSTFSGRIDNAFGPEARRTDRYTPGKELRFSHGGGSARVEVESFSGPVQLRQR